MHRYIKLERYGPRNVDFVPVLAVAAVPPSGTGMPGAALKGASTGISRATPLASWNGTRCISYLRAGRVAERTQ